MGKRNSNLSTLYPKQKPGFWVAVGAENPIRYRQGFAREEPTQSFRETW